MATKRRREKRGKQVAVTALSLLALLAGVVALNPIDLALGGVGLWWVSRHD